MPKPFPTTTGVATTANAWIAMSCLLIRNNSIYQSVIHKAFEAVDEAGTEAAAATAVIFDTTSTPDPPIELTLDNPFIFLIRDIETGSILFIGRVVDPS